MGKIYDFQHHSAEKTNTQSGSSKSNDNTSTSTQHNNAIADMDLIDNSNEPIYKDAYVSNRPVYRSETNSSQGFDDREIDRRETASGLDKKEIVEKIYYKERKEELNFQSIINTKALPAHSKTYELDKFEKNAMIIFNFEEIEGFMPRQGTVEDEKALRETFLKFDFEIEPPHKDLTKVEMFNVLENFTQQDFTDYGCVVIVILTHGTDQGLLRAKDEGQLYSEQDIINQFKARRKPTLFTKPVILIIQACRGKSSAKGVQVMRKMMISRDHDTDFKPYVLPVEADMLVFHSSYAGKPSFRPENGSWLIQTLCKQVNALHRTHDLESIFIEVKREVAIEKYYMEWEADEMQVNKQMPVVTSTLIRKLYLKGYNDKAPMLMPFLKKPGGNMSDTANLSEECQCFLEHFSYMKACLSHIVQSNPRDPVAKSLLDIARQESGIDNDKTKTTLILISQYLQKHYKNSDYHKYIYFYESAYAVDLEQIGGDSTLQRVAKTWGEWSQNNVVISLGTCVGAYLVYSFINKLR